MSSWQQKRRHHVLSKSWLLLTLLMGTVLLPAQEVVEKLNPITSQGMTDWTTGTFYLTLTAPIPDGDEAALPKRKYLVEVSLQDHIKEEFVRRIGEITMNGLQQLQEALAQDSALLNTVSQMADQLQFDYSRVNADFTQLEVRYSLSLWATLSALFPWTEVPNEFETPLLWTPSRAFSGIVIFAMGEFPWRSTGQHTAWHPSLAPRFLNPEGEVIFDRSYLHPEYLQKWGLAAYSHEKFNEETWRDRIGADPLRIVARSVSGKYPTDLVLAQDDWDILLSQPANQELLAEGRVLILWGDFPDYNAKPNPDSTIDETQPKLQVIPQPPPPAAEKPAKHE